MNTLWCVVADDFTGAGDSVIQFTEPARSVRLVLDPLSVKKYAKNAAALVVDTDSRFAPEDEAYSKVLRTVRQLRDRGVRKFYKKIDSTLRGNVAAEIAAVMDAGDYECAVVAPAAPKNGRTVAGGICLVGGVPVSATASLRDPFTPVSDPRVASLLEPRFPGAVGSLSLEQIRSGPEAIRALMGEYRARGVRVVVADSETIDDLRNVATLANVSGLLFAGSSGLAETLAERARIPDRSGLLPIIARGKALFVIGSITETSAAQCKNLVEAGGVTEVVLDSGAALAEPQKERARLRAAVRAADPEKSVLVRTSGLYDSDLTSKVNKEAGSALSRFIGSLAPVLLRERKAQFLFASGGDTAARIALSLGLSNIEFNAELLPGIPFGSFRYGISGKTVYFVSKSGGFGSPSAMSDALSMITSKERVV